jgi:Ca2+-binding RTX toxin-like protein
VAKGKPLRRKTRLAFALVPALLVLLVGGLSSSQAADPPLGDATAASDVSSGLQSLSESVGGLDGLDELGQNVPLTNLAPTGADGLNFANAFVQSLKDQLTGQAFSSLTELQAYLNDPARDGNFAGVHVDVGAPTLGQTGGIYTLGLTLDLTRPGASTPLKLDTSAVDVDGGSVGLTLHATASLTVNYDPTQAAGDRVYLDSSSSPKVETSIAASADFSTSPFHVNLGFTDVTVGGTVDVGAIVHADILDPDGNGRITSDEWSSTAAVNQFDVGFGATHATAAITLTSDIQTPLATPLPAATIGLNDTDLTNGLDTPSVSLGPLGDFKNIQPQDFLSGIGSVAVMMSALSSTGPAGFSFPFLHHDPSDKVNPIVEHVGDVAKFNERLVDFFQDNGLSSSDDPLSVVFDPSKLATVDTIQEVTSKLEAALGESAGDFGLRYDPMTKRLTFAIKVQRDATHDPIAPISARVDIADLLKNIGFTDLGEKAGSPFQATVSPDYNVDVGVGVDLNPAGGQSISQRFFVDTSGTELQANVPIAAQLDLVGRIGFLGVEAKSQVGGVDQSVQLLGPRDAGEPMLKLDLNGGPDDRLTLKEVFDALGGNPLSILNASSPSDVVNAAVPPFDLYAAASINDSGTNIVSGTAHISWNDVLDPSTLSLDADADFNEQLLDFDFDPENPAALFTKIMDVLGPFAHQLADLANQNPTLQQKLPVINKSFADLVTQFDTLRDQVDDLATDPAGFLQQFEVLVQDKIANAFGITDPTAIERILDMEVHNNSPASVIFHLGFGICGQPASAPDDPACSIRHELKQPLNFDLPDVGGLVGVQNQGEVELTAKAIAKLTFGVQLPDVSPNMGGVPSVSGSPELFVSTDPDDTAVNLDVNVDAQTVLTASIGPLTFSLGKGVAPETACGADTTDDDHDGFPNDGCPVDGAAEDVLSGQCANAFDDDADGDVNDGCPATGLPVTARVGAKFHLSHDTGGDHRLTIDPSNLTNLIDWLGDTVPTSLADFSPTTKVSCPVIPGTFDACASIPVFAGSDANSSLLGNITFTAATLLDPNTWDAHVDDGIINNILGAKLDWTTLVHGIKYVADNLQTQLDASTYGGKKLPVIGHALDGGAEVVRNFREKIVNPMDELATDIETNGSSFDLIQNKIKTFLVTHIGTDTTTPFHLLKYAGGAGTADATDVEVQLLCGTNEHTCDAAQGDGLAAISDAQVRFAVGGDVVNQDLDFDIGFPGLRLTVDKSSNPDENLHATVGYRLDVNFGLSKKYGFYVQTDNPATAAGRTDELTLDAAVDMPGSAHGDIAFLRLDISNNHNAATHDDLSLVLGADIKGGDTDTADNNHKKLGLDDLASSDPAKAADVAVSVTGGVDLDLHLITSIQMPEGISLGGAEGALPKLLANFTLHWGFGAGVSLNGGLDPESGANPLEVGFNNIELDLGQFFDAFLGPIVREVQRWTKPLQPVIDTISAPIPGISDLSELAGAGPITMLDFLENATGADLTLIRQIIKLIDVVNHLPSSGSIVDLGQFGLDEHAVEGPAPTGDNADKLIDGTDPQNSSPTNVFTTPSQCNPACSISNADKLTTAMSQDPAEDDGAGLHFPSFEHPTQLFGLLVGKDVTLIEFDAGTLQASAGLDITIGPFPAGPVPVSIIVGGSFGVEGHFAIGYSTRGIRLAVKALTDDDTSNDGFFNVTGLLFDGVFFDDLNAAGDDVPEIRLIAEIHAGAEVDIVIASAGVIVGLKATVDLNLHDGGRPTDPAKVDGKLYIDEIASMLNNPICIFDVDGALDAFVKFFVTVGISPFDFSFDITLVEVRLLDMKAITDPICEHPPPPHLATEDDASKTLRLNIGPFAGDRDVAEDEHDEKVVVRQLDNGPGPGHRFSVSGFGIVQEYPEQGHPLIERIFADGGDGKDSILMDEGVANTNTSGGGVDNSQTFPMTVPVEACGGSDVDKIQGGDVADFLVGDGHKDGSNIHCTSVDVGSGGDNLGGGKGADTLDGNGGGDTLGGAEGNDTINGGSGNDNATGGEGHDTINGGADNDALGGGPEQDPANGVVSVADVSDTINGNAGDDTLDGGFGDDTLNGGADKDHLSGGDGVDHENGNADDDVIVGGKAGDIISGGTANDVIFGEDGSDTIDGDAGNDDIVAGKDDSAGPATGDHVDGGPDRDYILGDEGLIQRTSGNADGTITPSGNFVGNDVLSGGSEGDVIYGEFGADQINGDAGPDELHGNVGDDTMNGGTEGDVMFGDAGADTMNGDAGSDTMRGGTEADTMHGNGDGDFMFGDSGQDQMFGDDGDDVMRGGISADTMHGNADHDVMNGDAEPDTMHGDGGPDTMHGDAADDYMEGNGDVDTMTGDAGEDDMLGGSGSAGQPDAGDTMKGGDGVTPNLTQDFDVLVGDNGKIERPGGTKVTGAKVRTVTIYDLDSSDTSLYGGDTMSGDQDDDELYGGGGGDTIHGNAGDDYEEGNPGGDSLYGDQGQDDLIGGTSQGGGGHPDGDDCIQGDERGNDCGGSGSGGGSGPGGTGGGSAGGDVVAGDNASIARSINAGGTDWVRDSFGFGANEIVRRAVTLYDVETVGHVLDPSLAGDDTIYGDAQRDVIWGQGGSDTIHGGNGDDYAEGNQADDHIFGENGNDDLVGGSEPATRLDAGDTISGGADFDVIAGDNALIARTLVDGHWVKNTFNDGIQHERRVLRDQNSPDEAVVSGGDTITGEGQDDLIYGQGGDDTVSGGDGDDAIEGNSNAGGSPAGAGSALPGDTIHGDAGQDDIVGGTTQPAIYDGPDTIFGDAAEDVIAGDNATLPRPTNPADSGHWFRDDRRVGETVQVVRRDITLLDVDVATQPAQLASVSGGDAISGGDAYDQIFGQGGGDTVHGDGGDDYVEGNAGGDTLWGDLGDDDVTGGGSANDGVIDADRVGEDLRDGDDTIHGDSGDAAVGAGDAIAGDNARILRPLTAGGLWRTDADRGATLRDILLFDVQKVGGAGGFTAPAEASGADTIFGEGGPDVAFGQGNGSLINAWGNESGAPGAANCFDGSDNADANDPYNPLADLSDPDCRAATPNGDQLYGQDGADYLEGNQGSDLVAGGGEEDDVIGGSSSNNGRIDTIRTPAERSGPLTAPVNLLDANDNAAGNGDDDTVLGDNGFVDRYLGTGGAWIHVNSAAMLGITTPVTSVDGGSYGPYDLVRRNVTSTETPESAGAFGSDIVLGGLGHDDLYGQLGDDWIEGGSGEDAVVGDMGHIDDNLLGTTAEGLTDPAPLNHFIAPQQPFLDDTIDVRGVLKREVKLFAFTGAGAGIGNDTAQGNEDSDWIHMGAGDDLANGNDGEDRLWGGDNTDATPLANNQAKVDGLWGGDGHDHLWGGYGADFLDVRPRTTASAPGLAKDDPPSWFQLAGPGIADFEGRDYIYGGWDQDAMQANFGDNGPQPGDRLLDWSGAYNVYYVCPSTYGDYISTRAIAPGLITFLQDLSQGDGAFNTATTGTSGFRETAMVFPSDVKFNTNPVHPDTPGHFTCGP